MNKFIISSSLILLVLILSCKPKEEASPANNSSSAEKSYVKFKADGQEQLLDFSENSSVITEATIKNNILTIKAYSNIYNTAESKIIEMEFKNASTAQTSYNITSSGNKFGYILNPSFKSWQIRSTMAGSSGTLEITKFKDLGNATFAVNGKFSGIAINEADKTQMLITEGEFFDLRTR